MAKRLIIILAITALLISTLSAGFGGAAVYETSIIYGDADGDGKVSTKDAVTVLRAAAGLKSLPDEAAFQRADVNGDGEITIFDARQILRGATGLLSLQPSGKFEGFENDGSFIADEEAIVSTVKNSLNKIKTDGNGYGASFIKTENDELTTFEMGEVEFIGINFGTGSSAVAGLIKDIIVSEDTENEETIISAGSQDYSLVPIENSTKVSNLSTADIFGLKASYDAQTGLATFKVAIPDTEIEGLTQSAYTSVLNTEIMLEQTNKILVRLLGSNSVDSEMRREFKNGELTVVIDAASGNIESYKITYESEMYIAEASIKTNSFSGLAKAKDVRFGKTHTIEFTEFNWANAQ